METEPEKNSKIKRLIPKRLIAVIIIAFIMGALGGIFGYNLAANNILNNSGNTITGTKTYNVTEQSGVVSAVKKTSPAVVSITSVQSTLGFFGAQQTQSSGTGFIVAPDGLIVTNKHVVADQNANYSVFTSDGKEYKATVKARDPLNDIAFLKIDASNLPTVALGDSDKLQVGQTVIAIGNALGQYQNSVTTGVISGIGRAIQAGDSSGKSSENLQNVIQTDAAINPGNSGGPLVNIDGQVIGINTAVDQQGQSIGFAIPINMIKKQIDQVRVHGVISRPILGIRYIPITKDFAARNDLKTDKGILVYGGSDIAVLPDSAAAKAGIKENDIILSIGGTNIDENHSVTGILQNYSPGDKVDVKILRDGKESTVQVTLGKTESK